MTLNRESLFTLIGNDRRRYHSAILTTFSFDPDFFEQQVMSHLWHCGIRNVNVLVDGYNFNEVVHQTAGRVTRDEFGSLYSIYPIFQSAIFHPKIWLLIGQNEGLLIVGSGNMTSAGHLSNDEIWGAFHVSATAVDNQYLFASAWAYLNRYTHVSKGHFREKTNRWITDQAAWIHDLPIIKQVEFWKTARENRVTLLHDTPEQTIWQQLNYHLRDQNITAITTVSPYYDQNGQALQELLAAHPNATIHAVLDDRGRVPATMSSNPNVSFFDWKECGVVRDKHARLHAKLIHWKAVNGTEYCLFGSANVTSAGLGLSYSSFTNAEASLLIEVPAGNILTELGLVINEENKRPLSSFRVTNNQPADQLATIRSNQRARLYGVELELDELTIHWEADSAYLYQIQLFDKDNRLVDTLPADSADERLRFKLSVENQKTRFAQVVDLETQQPVSNKLPVAYLNQLYKTVPNPVLADIESIHAEILTGDMSRLLSLLTFAMNSEESTDQSSVDIPHSNPAIRSEPVQSVDLPLKAHTDYSFSDNRAEVSLLYSPVLRVLDLLRFVRSPVSVTEYYGDIQDDEQEIDLSVSTGSDASKTKNQSLPNKAACISESRLIMNYLKQFTNYLTQVVAEEKPNEKTPVTITLLSKYLIAIELLLKYGGKVVRYDDNGQYGSTNYLPFNEEENHTVKSVKGCCYLLIGSFLHLTRYGFKKYSLPYSQNKVEQFKQEALVETVVCLLNVRWDINEDIYFRTLLLNTLHSLGWRTAQEYYQSIKDLLTQIEIRANELTPRQACFEINRAFFVDELCPNFLVATIKRNTKSFSAVANVNQLIYTSFTGYCYIVSKASPSLGEYIVAKPGYKWSPNRKTFCYEHFIKIPQFVLVG